MCIAPILTRWRKRLKYKKKYLMLSTVELIPWKLQHCPITNQEYQTITLELALHFRELPVYIVHRLDREWIFITRRPTFFCLSYKNELWYNFIAVLSLAPSTCYDPSLLKYCANPVHIEVIQLYHHLSASRLVD